VNLSFVRWYALVKVIEPRFTPGPAFLLGYIGNVFNLVIPGAVGGDFIKDQICRPATSRFLSSISRHRCAAESNACQLTSAPGSVHISFNPTCVNIQRPCAPLKHVVGDGIFTERLAGKTDGLNCWFQRCAKTQPLFCRVGCGDGDVRFKTLCLRRSLQHSSFSSPSVRDCFDYFPFSARRKVDCPTYV